MSALNDPALTSVQLVLSGVGAKDHISEFEKHSPSLQGRILAVGLSNYELAMVYRKALAVVMPSRIEGFGLPVIEVMAAGGHPLIADSRGLREAGAEAVLRFSPDQPAQLVDWLCLLLDSDSRNWLQSCLEPKVKRRLSRLHPDLLGIFFV